MILFSNAKINIGLAVQSKREDGFHNIESIFYPVPFFDVMEVLPHETDVFQISGLEAPLENNLVTEALELLRKDFPIPPVFIHLHKRIPLGSGLGGGSSNASHAILAINHLFNLELGKDKMMDYAAYLGSDCPFFIENEPAKVTGRGEHIQLVDLDLSDFWIKIIHDDIHVSTADAFRFMTPSEQSFPDDFLTHPNSFVNDFETTVFQFHPQLQEIKQTLINEGATYASMSGSGSAIYGLFEQQPKYSGKYKTEVIVQLK